MAEITQLRRTAASEPPVERTSGAPAQVTAVDVVCEMVVAQDTSIQASHAGETYYFCSDGCKTRFLESPEAFVQ